MSDNLLSRFLRYVQVDTQSDETSNTFPSTPGQLVLLEMLKQELSELGAADVQMTKHGYVMASIPANTRKARRADRGLSRPRGYGTGLLRQKRETDRSSQGTTAASSSSRINRA